LRCLGARGETVDTQVVVARSRAGGLTNVNVSATALTGPNGATIAASSVTLYRGVLRHGDGHGELRWGQQSHRWVSGTYAEPLIPFNDPETGRGWLCNSSATLKACNASVSSGQNQPYWIDISIPHGVANQPGGNLHRQRYGFPSSARNIDDSGFR